MSDVITQDRLASYWIGFNKASKRRLKDRRVSQEEKEKIISRYSKGRPEELSEDFVSEIEKFNPQLISGPERNRRRLLGNTK